MLNDGQKILDQMATGIPWVQYAPCMMLSYFKRTHFIWSSQAYTIQQLVSLTQPCVIGQQIKMSNTSCTDYLDVGQGSWVV